MANWLTNLLNVTCNAPVAPQGDATRAIADRMYQDGKPSAQVDALRELAAREDTQPIYAEVGGVTVDLASPEYHAWYRQHYG